VKNFAVESYQLLVKAYGETALSETTCRDWFRHFKSGDFYMENEEHAGRSKLVEDAELEALLDEDPYQTQEELEEHNHWKLLNQPFPCIQKHWK